MDESQPSTSPPPDQDLSYIANDPRVGRLVRVLAELGTDLQQEVETHRTRADAAEHRLDGVTKELEDAHAELEAVRAQLETLRSAVRDYFEECADAQEALLAVTRYALGLAPLPPPFDAHAFVTEPRVGGTQSAHVPQAAPPEKIEPAHNAPGAAVRSADAAFPLDGWPPHSSAPLNLVEIQGLADLRDEPTDEHKIIDDRNRLDLERLNARSYVHSFRAGRTSS